MYIEAFIFEGKEILKATAMISGIKTNTETWIRPMKCQLLQEDSWSCCGYKTIPHCLANILTFPFSCKAEK